MERGEQRRRAASERRTAARGGDPASSSVDSSRQPPWRHRGGPRRPQLYERPRVAPPHGARAARPRCSCSVLTRQLMEWLESETYEQYTDSCRRGSTTRRPRRCAGSSCSPKSSSTACRLWACASASAHVDRRAATWIEARLARASRGKPDRADARPSVQCCCPARKAYPARSSRAAPDTSIAIALFQPPRLRIRVRSEPRREVGPDEGAEACSRRRCGHAAAEYRRP